MEKGLNPNENSVFLGASKKHRGGLETLKEDLETPRALRGTWKAPRELRPGFLFSLPGQAPSKNKAGEDLCGGGVPLWSPHSCVCLKPTVWETVGSRGQEGRGHSRYPVCWASGCHRPQVGKSRAQGPAAAASSATGEGRGMKHSSQHRLRSQGLDHSRGMTLLCSLLPGLPREGLQVRLQFLKLLSLVSLHRWRDWGSEGPTRS